MRLQEPGQEADWNRRGVLRLAGAAMAAGVAQRAAAQRRPKRVIVVGAGIGGLSCACELARLGHDPVVLEASGRAGGHVKTLKDQFSDGLYADVGAEHFYYPGYTRFWGYVKEFGLQPMPYPRRDEMQRFFKGGTLYSEAELRSAAVLRKFELNDRECKYLSEHGWPELPLLYVSKYIEQIRDEREPFAGNLRELDTMTMGDLLRREGASPGAVQYFGGGGSALHMVWGAAVKRLRGTPFESKKLFRLVGGNQEMTNALAERLKEKIRYGAPVTALEHSGSGVAATCTVMGQPKRFEGDYMVLAISLAVLRQIPVTPGWPESKHYLIQQMPYTTKTRVIFQTRARFWEQDKVSPNWTSPDPKLNELWAMAEEVKTPRGILVGGSQPGVTAAASRDALLKGYTGRSADIEHITQHEWAKDPWAGMCERATYRPGDMTRFWPEASLPVGRVHFAGAYAAQMSWGMEAALESSYRAVQAIDKA